MQGFEECLVVMARNPKPFGSCISTVDGAGNRAQDDMGNSGLGFRVYSLGA